MGRSDNKRFVADFWPAGFWPAGFWPVGFWLVLLLGGCSTTASAPDERARISTTPRQEAVADDPFGLVGRDRAGLRVGTFAEALALPPSELDLGRAALLLAREDRRGVDVVDALTQLDVLAVEARELREAQPGLSQRDVLDAVVCRRFLPDRADPAGTSADNLYLDRVLLRRRGYCVSLSLLVMAVCERLGWACQGMRLPQHYFVLVDGLPLETTAGGRPAMPRDHTRRQGPLPPRSILADVLSNRGALLHLQGRSQEALASFDQALQVDASLATAWFNRGALRARVGDLAGGEADLSRAIEIDSRFGEAFARRAQVRLRRGDAAGAEEDVLRARSLLEEPSRSAPFGR